ncbi:VAN3-binding protein [Apium graveolens]|uniref:VAN3-binding protein n=1 Tax=Apium graveolens TaxID=4045 RepID=UPI003D7B9C8A
MEGDHLMAWNKRSFSWINNADEEENEEVKVAETPQEPLDFLSRSWSLSATEISKALAQKNVQKQFIVDNNNPILVPETVIAPPHMKASITNVVNARKPRTIGRWFHIRETRNSTVKKKDKARIENAHLHSAISVAGVAAALAAVAATKNANESGTKMSMSVASATELLASYCIEMAESAGAAHDTVASVVKSSIDIASPSDLLTLTAAAATALRGEAALKERASKDGNKVAAISPYDKNMTEARVFDALQNESEGRHPPCIGDLLQYTCKGIFRWKHVSIYINNKYEVIIKLKSKHVGGAFSKKNKCVVYGICDEATAWPFRKERENVEAHFGVKTAKGLLEFKCKNKIHKQRWVEGIQDLLCRTISIYEAQQSLSFLNIK